MVPDVGARARVFVRGGSLDRIVAEVEAFGP